MSGIKPLVSSEDVLEVKIVGPRLPMRLFGYIFEGTLHIVKADNSSNHGSESRGKNNISTVRKIRSANGH